MANGLRTGPKTVQVTAAADDLPTATASVLVHDGDVDHYGWSAVSGLQVAGVPFPVTLQAYDILNNPISVYSGTVSLGSLRTLRSPSTRRRSRSLQECARGS